MSNKTKTFQIISLHIIFHKFAMSDLVIVNLLKCYYLPIFLHGSEAVCLSKFNEKYLDNYLNLAVMKIFHLSEAARTLNVQHVIKRYAMLAILPKSRYIIYICSLILL